MSDSNNVVDPSDEALQDNKGDAAPDGSVGVKVILRALAGDRVTTGALLFLVFLVVAAVLHPLILTHDPMAQSLANSNLSPGSLTYLLGTDALGRDMLARLLRASRVSLAVGFLGVIVSALIGVSLGLTAGFVRGRTERLIMSIVDLQMSIPFLLIALVTLFIIGGGVVNVIIVLALVRWPLYARVSRGLALSLRESLFVDAARNLGASNRRVIFRHILPNMASPLVVLSTLEVARLIMAESTVSFLGVGIQPPETSWGLMVSQGRESMNSAPWNVYLPGALIFLTALSTNLLATWARAVTDPVQRWRWLLPRGGRDRGSDSAVTATS